MDKLEGGEALGSHVVRHFVRFSSNVGVEDLRVLERPLKPWVLLRLVFKRVRIHRHVGRCDGYGKSFEAFGSCLDSRGSFLEIWSSRIGEASWIAVLVNHGDLGLDLADQRVLDIAKVIDRQSLRGWSIT